MWPANQSQPASDAAPAEVDRTIPRLGFIASASDLVPMAVRLREGLVITAPVWSPQDTAIEDRVFTVLGRERVTVEGTEVVAWKVEERVRATGALEATWWLSDASPYMVLGETRLPEGGVDDRVIVIVDDVSYTGRTARAAMDELADFGRPRRILLCVLVDRGGRELPIQPDIVGRHVEVPEGGRVEVLVPELDGRLAVELGRTEAG